MSEGAQTASVKVSRQIRRNRGIMDLMGVVSECPPC